MPMIPMSPEEELPMEGAPPAAPGPMGGDPMMDVAEPTDEEMAMMLGSRIEQRRAMSHAMVDQAADADLQNVIGMIAQAAQGAQVMGQGQLA